MVIPEVELVSRTKEALHQATEYARSIAKEDGHWYGELRANVTITAEQVFFLHIFGGEKNSTSDADEYKRYLLSEQQRDGSWSIAPEYPGDVSTSCEAYLALRLLGVSKEDPVLINAKEFIRRSGGVERVRVFTRFYFAQFGLFPWDATPQLPVEFILVPYWAPMSIYSLSSWSRSTVIPLMIVAHHRPIHSLPNGRFENNDFLDELWIDPSDKMVPLGPDLSSLWATDRLAFIFAAIDKAVNRMGGLRSTPLRGHARKKCLQWILEHQETEGDWGGIIPPMHFGVQALFLEGYPVSSPEIQGGVAAIERFTWQDSTGKRLQSCISPVWDTCLMLRGLCDAGTIPLNDPQLQIPTAWLSRRQIMTKGDWKILRPHLSPGGFAFEYNNTWYPDVDDTAAVILAIMRQDAMTVTTTTLVQAIQWMLGMQNMDGGWAAFDYQNDKLWLNRLPFADMKSLCDPSTADVTGRIIESLGMFLQLSERQNAQIPRELEKAIHRANSRAIVYLEQEQEANGSWYGRWGSNYIYGTSNVLCGLWYFKNSNTKVQAIMEKGADWMRACQNFDGGWGEQLQTYLPGRKLECGSAPSTPSQTAWAIMALLAVGESSDSAVKEGVRYLLETQTSIHGRGKSWPERLYTGTGFPNHFYIGYTLYRHYFPLMALGRFMVAASSNDIARVDSPMMDSPMMDSPMMDSSTMDRASPTVRWVPDLKLPEPSDKVLASLTRKGNTLSDSASLPVGTDLATTVRRKDVLVMAVGDDTMVQHCIDIAKRLAEHHRVRVAACSPHRRSILKLGIEFYDVGGSYDESVVRQSILGIVPTGFGNTHRRQTSHRGVFRRLCWATFDDSHPQWRRVNEERPFIADVVVAGRGNAAAPHACSCVQAPLLEVKPIDDSISRTWMDIFRVLLAWTFMLEFFASLRTNELKFKQQMSSAWLWTHLLAVISEVVYRPSRKSNVDDNSIHNVVATMPDMSFKSLHRPCALLPRLPATWKHIASRRYLSEAAAASLVSSDSLGWTDLEVLATLNQDTAISENEGMLWLKNIESSTRNLRQQQSSPMKHMRIRRSLFDLECLVEQCELSGKDVNNIIVDTWRSFVT